MKRFIDEMATQVLREACDKNLTIVTAESCTAGAIAEALSRAKGASTNLHGGFVTYTKDMKSEALGVSAALLKEKTAVCPEVAIAMAQGALARSPADIAVSVTGVAGPAPDEDGNPVGLIVCAAALRDGATRSLSMRSAKQKREDILDDAVCHALRLLRTALEAK